MNTKHLKSFIEAARTKSLSKAGLHLNYAQSTIYEHICSLESELKTELYFRRSKGIELTPQGEYFLSYAQRIINLYDEAVGAMSVSEPQYVKVGASETSDFALMSELIREYLKLYPSAKLEYNKMTTDISLSKLAVGACDVCFVCERHLESDELDIRCLTTVPLVFAAHPRHSAIVRGLRKSPNKEVLIGTMTVPNAESMLESIGLDYDELFHSLTIIGDFKIAKDLALNKQGVALLPLRALQKEFDEGILARVPDIEAEVLLNVYVVTQKNKWLSPATTNLIDLAFDMFGSCETIKNTV